MTCKIERIFSGERPYQNMEQSEYVSFNDLNDKPVAIYGLGECSHWFHEIAMKRLGLSPVVALDRNPQTQSWWGVKTATPEIFAATSDISTSRLHVVVNIGSRDTFNMIQRDLLALGFETIIFLHDFYEIQSLYVWDPKEVLRRMMASTEKFKKRITYFKMNSVKNFLSPSASAFDTTTLDIPFSPRDEQYFPSDIPLNKGHHTYVCCGAYDGENIRLLRKKIKHKHYHLL